MNIFTKCIPGQLPESVYNSALFCLWRYETVGGRENSKVPYNPNTFERAKANDPQTFADFATACAAGVIADSKGNHFDGLGIGIFGKMAAIDIDHCIDDAGQLSPMAADIVRIMGSYTEKSPSGKGLRILFFAPGLRVDKDKYYTKNPNNKLEIYIAGIDTRYVTVTGDRLNAFDIGDRSGEVQTVIEKYMQRPQQAEQTHNAPAVPLSLSDAELIEIACASKHGENAGALAGTPTNFSALWRGDFSGYNSQSEADQALCNMLAFYAQGNAARIDSLFRQSGLMRDKWDTHQKYREKTISNAIASCREFYTPKRAADPAPAPAPVEEKQPPQPKRSSVELFDQFLETIQTEAFKPIKTGIPALDELLGGGFEPQSLVLLGGAPGAGKTALAQQIFETMAANGHDVIYLNFEMSREQLLARSISRMAAKTGGSISAAQVMRGYLWTDKQRRIVQNAAMEYRRTIAPHMEYNPDNTAANLPAIKAELDAAREMAQQAGKNAPIVVVDYIHLIQTDGRQEQAEVLKAAVKLLKDYAIAGNTFTFAIMANNRDSNSSGEAGLYSGRDTSNLEYSADTMIQLTLTDKAKNAEDYERLTKENPRRVTLKLVKKRLTALGDPLKMEFDGASGTFTPIVNDDRYPRRYSDNPDRIII